MLQIWNDGDRTPAIFPRLVATLLRHPFASCDPTAAMAALSTPQNGLRARACVDHLKMSAPAARADKAWDVGCLLWGQVHFRSPRRLESRTRLFGLSPDCSVPNKTQPAVPAATAQPTRQSSQWLSACSGRIFHSSTVRPRPSVRTRYSAVRCSARSRCCSGSASNSDRHPGSPCATTNLAWTNDFQ